MLYCLSLEKKKQEEISLCVCCHLPNSILQLKERLFRYFQITIEKHVTYEGYHRLIPYYRKSCVLFQNGCSVCAQSV